MREFVHEVAFLAHRSAARGRRRLERSQIFILLRRRLAVVMVGFQ